MSGKMVTNVALLMLLSTSVLGRSELLPEFKCANASRGTCRLHCWGGELSVFPSLCSFYTAFYGIQFQRCVTSMPCCYWGGRCQTSCGAGQIQLLSSAATCSNATSACCIPLRSWHATTPASSTPATTTTTTPATLPSTTPAATTTITTPTTTPTTTTTTTPSLPTLTTTTTTTTTTPTTTTSTSTKRNIPTTTTPPPPTTSTTTPATTTTTTTTTPATTTTTQTTSTTTPTTTTTTTPPTRTRRTTTPTTSSRTTTTAVPSSVAARQGVCGSLTARRSGSDDDQLPGWLQPRLIGGTVSGTASWPWMARLTYASTSGFCAGVLVDDDTVVTVAHCVAGVDAGTMRVVLGDHSRLVSDPETESVGVARYIVTDTFRRGTRGNDYAVLKLDRTISFTDRKMAACLPDPTVIPLVSPPSCVVAGWGVSSPGELVGPLREINVRLRARASCEQLLGITLPSDIICADNLPNAPTDGCRYDDGDMLVCEDVRGRWSLMGIMSEYSCGHGLPILFTDVRRYVDFTLDLL